MEVRQLIDRVSAYEKNSYLYEGLDSSTKHTMLLWETAGLTIKEAALTSNQIQQLFTDIEKSVTDSGKNRTLLGKGKDAAGAVNKAWEDLKTKIQNSGPIKNVDSLYDQAAEKLKQSTGGDEGVMKYVQKYRDFAKKHPVAQSFIYSALIAAAGISGAGLAGAGALALLKMTDKLLQGEKFSSAAYSGAKTGAMAYGASKVGDLVKGTSDVGASSASADTGSVAQNTLAATRKAAEQQAMDAIKSRIANGDIKAGDMSAIRDLAYKVLDGSGMPAQAIETSVEKLVTRSMAAAAKESVELKHDQIVSLFNKIEDDVITEGILDTIKGKVQQFGKNLTTKVTADKLNSAWKSAGAPTDSNQLANFLKQQGVGSDIISKAYSTLGIEAPSQASAQAPNQSQKGGTQINIDDLAKQIAQLKPKEQKEIMALLAP